MKSLKNLCQYHSSNRSTVIVEQCVNRFSLARLLPIEEANPNASIDQDKVILSTGHVVHPALFPPIDANAVKAIGVRPKEGRNGDTLL